jgi:hypothetical protein
MLDEFLVNIKREKKLIIKQLISAYYPLTADLINSYGGVDYSKLDFGLVSINKNINWEIEFIEQFTSGWNWSYLSSNPSLPWSIDFLQKFQKFWDWDVSARRTTYFLD